MQLSNCTDSLPASRTALGPLLVQRALVSRDGLAAAETLATSKHVELVDAVVALGLVSEADSYAALAEATGAELTTLENASFTDLAVRLVPEKAARRHLVVPIHVDDRVLTYATCRAISEEAETDLRFASGRKVTGVVATRSAVMSALDRCYPKAGEDVKKLDALAKVSARSGHANAAPLIEMCNELVAHASAMGASEVVVEYSPNGGAIEFRGGKAVESLPFEPAVFQPLAERFKLMARVGVVVRTRPQSGTIRMTVNGQPTDVHLSTQPTTGGERVTMTIGAPSMKTEKVSPFAPAPVARLARPARRRRVLVADDEPMTRMLLRMLLERDQFDVLEAKDGREAVTIARRECPDLVLIDLNMPVMNGYDAVAQLRERFTPEKLRIIALSADEGQGVDRRVFDLGADDFILKPFEAPVLSTRVAALFNRQRLMAA